MRVEQEEVAVRLLGFVSQAAIAVTRDGERCKSGVCKVQTLNCAAGRDIQCYQFFWQDLRCTQQAGASLVRLKDSDSNESAEKGLRQADVKVLKQGPNDEKPFSIRRTNRLGRLGVGRTSSAT